MSLRVNMPATLLERLPLPSLRTYVGFSVLALFLAFYHAHRTVKQFSKMLDFDAKHCSIENYIEDIGEVVPPVLANVTLPNPPIEALERWKNMLNMMRFGTWYGWTLVNIHFCLLILVWKLIQKVVFGKLRFLEKRFLKVKFWNFALNKFLFIFGVMKVQRLGQVIFWVGWFSFLGLLHVLTHLSKQRLEYLSLSVVTPQSAHVKVLLLLGEVLLLSGEMFMSFVRMANGINFTIFTFMAAEILLLMLKNLGIIVRYVIQQECMRQQFEREELFVYLDNTDLAFGLVIFSVDFAHHLHMLVDPRNRRPAEPWITKIQAYRPSV